MSTITLQKTGNAQIELTREAQLENILEELKKLNIAPGMLKTTGVEL